MNLTNEQLRRIIKEELEAVLKEDHPGWSGGTQGDEMIAQRRANQAQEREDAQGEEDRKAGVLRKIRSKEIHPDSDLARRNRDSGEKRKERAQARADKAAASEQEDINLQKVLDATGRYMDEDMHDKLRSAAKELGLADHENVTSREIRKVFKKAGVPVKGLGRKFKSFFGFEE